MKTLIQLSQTFPAWGWAILALCSYGFGSKAAMQIMEPGLERILQDIERGIPKEQAHQRAAERFVDMLLKSTPVLLSAAVGFFALVMFVIALYN